MQRTGGEVMLVRDFQRRIRRHKVTAVVGVAACRAELRMFVAWETEWPVMPLTLRNKEKG